MSENIFGPLVNSLVDAIGVTVKYVCKGIGMRFNKYDFESFFKGANIKNHVGDIPRFLKWNEKENYDVYFFSVPAGVEVIDFKKEITSLSNFLGVDESLLEIRLAENLKDMELIVFHKKDVQKYNFYDFFSDVELKNIREDYPRMKSYSDEKFYEKYIFNTPSGLNINDFRQKINSLALFLGIKEEDLRFEINENLKDVELRILKEFGEIDFSMLDLNKNFNVNDFRIPLGVDISKNSFLYWNMIDDANWNCYIAGTTGCGKTNIVRLILTYLCAIKTSYDVEFCLFNTKILDMKMFRNVVQTKNYVHAKEKSLDMMEQLVNEMKTRYEMLNKLGFDDWYELRKEQRLPYKIIVIEELAEYKNFNKWHNYFEKLLTQGRGAGMIVIATTQLPSIDIMSSLSKQCFNTTIAMKSKDNIRASIIVDDENANLDKLKGKGHAKIYDSEHDAVEFKALKISKKQIQEIINANKVKSSS